MNVCEIKIPLERIVRQAGDLLLDYYSKPILKEYKKGHELVTNADRAVEQFLIKKLKMIVPEAGIIAEESKPNIAQEWNWVIDPIDGTVNFSQKIPYFCISVALTQHHIPVVGMIYQPVNDELFYAIAYGGAYLNGQKIFVSKTTDISQAVAGAALAHGIESLKFWKGNVYKMRHLGAYALDLAYIACARFDCAILWHFRWWDVVAGALLVQEAGGRATDIYGDEIMPKSRILVASNANIHAPLREKASLVFTI